VRAARAAGRARPHALLRGHNDDFVTADETPCDRGADVADPDDCGEQLRGSPSLPGHVFFLVKLLKVCRNSLATSRGLITIGAS
jgi:hypothetical protein